MQENTLEYWRSRALRAENRLSVLQEELNKTDAKYRAYEKEAVNRYEEACKSFESLIIESLKKTDVAKPIITGAAVHSHTFVRAPPAAPLAIDTCRTVTGPPLALKPKRAPPVPPGKAFGAGSSSNGSSPLKKY